MLAEAATRDPILAHRWAAQQATKEKTKCVNCDIVVVRRRTLLIMRSRDAIGLYCVSCSARNDELLTSSGILLQRLWLASSLAPNTRNDCPIPALCSSTDTGNI